MTSDKCLIISTSYDDLLDSFSTLKRTLKTRGFKINELKNIDQDDIDSKKFLSEYDYFFFVISNSFSPEIEIEKFLEVLENIQLSGKKYWCVCDQQTIYARTLLRDLKILSSYIDCLPYHVPNIIYLIFIYHMLTKENILDAEQRVGNWVHPYRTTEELPEYFFTQIGYLND